MTMTTPEKIRARQLRLGITVAVLGVLTVVWGVVLESQAMSQRHCLQDSMRQLNNSYSVRAKLNDQRNEILTRKADLLDQQVAAQHDLIKSVSTATSQVDVKQAFATFNQGDVKLTQESQTVTQQLTQLTKEISQTTIPAFPEGKCS